MTWPLELHDVLASTSTTLRARLAQGAIPPLAILARRQTAGRGRRGRTWSTPPGNLAFSVAPPPLAIPDGHWSLLAGLATLEALRPGPSLKWPNDILLGGAKLAGILIEQEGGHRLIGIGVNCAAAPSLPDRPTACLAGLGPAPDPIILAHAILARLAHWHTRLAAGAGQGTLVSAWLARAHPVGTPLALTTATGLATGTFAGLAEDGALLLQSGPDRSTHHSAEIIHARLTPACCNPSPSFPYARHDALAPT